MNIKPTIILVLMLAIVGFYLVTEHRAHLYGYSQYILFGAFILLHFFMHADHGGHGENKKGGHH